MIQKLSFKERDNKGQFVKEVRKRPRQLSDKEKKMIEDFKRGKSE